MGTAKKSKNNQKRTDETSRVKIIAGVPFLIHR
jgi:hypothetical protein